LFHAQITVYVFKRQNTSNRVGLFVTVKDKANLQMSG